MKLPQIDAYSFAVTLPSSNTVISMRPYLVREEKLLLMAQESQNYDEQAEAVAQIIRNCTNGIVEPRTAPFFDIEFLLLQLRARSVGEVATPIYECRRIAEGTDKICGNKTTITVPIADIKVDTDVPRNLSIPLSERFTLNLRYPTIYTINQMFKTTVVNGVVSQATAIDALTDLFDTLTDSAEHKLYDFSTYNKAEQIEFLESLAPNDYDKLVKFLETMPTLKYDINYVCSKCQFSHHIKVSGLADFLAWGLGTTPS